jgi:hypothetical protein
MNVLDIEKRKGTRRSPQRSYLPQVRPSILDPQLDDDPYLHPCPCQGTMVLFLNNHPLVVIPGSSFDYTSLGSRLNQLRHRYPRRRFSR